MAPPNWIQNGHFSSPKCAPNVPPNGQAEHVRIGFGTCNRYEQCPARREIQNEVAGVSVEVGLWPSVAGACPHLGCHLGHLGCHLRPAGMCQIHFVTTFEKQTRKVAIFRPGFRHFIWYLPSGGAFGRFGPFGVCFATRPGGPFIHVCTSFTDFCHFRGVTTFGQIPHLDSAFEVRPAPAAGFTTYLPSGGALAHFGCDPIWTIWCTLSGVAIWGVPCRRGPNPFRDPILWYLPSGGYLGAIRPKQTRKVAIFRPGFRHFIWVPPFVWGFRPPRHTA